MSELEATSEGNPSEDGSGPEEEEEEEEERGRGVLRCSDTAKKLESAAFNYVSLGQWEAARASFAVLASEPESRENAKELLKILILDSASHWCEWGNGAGVTVSVTIQFAGCSLELKVSEHVHP